MTITADKDLHSIGKLSELFQSSPGAIENAAANAGIMPALRLNGVIYFADSQLQEIRRHLQRSGKR